MIDEQIHKLIATKIKKPGRELFEYRKSDYLIFLTHVDSNHYIDVYVYTCGLIRITFRRNDTKIIDLALHKEKHLNDVLIIEKHLDVFIILIDEYLSQKSRLDKFSRGIIPSDLIRNLKIEKILNNE